MFPGSELQFMANVNYSRQAKILEGLTGSVCFLVRPSTSGGSSPECALPCYTSSGDTIVVTVHVICKSFPGYYTFHSLYNLLRAVCWHGLYQEIYMVFTISRRAERKPKTTLILQPLSVPYFRSSHPRCTDNTILPAITEPAKNTAHQPPG